MKMRSTGLGKTELCGDISKLERMEECLVLHVNTTAPVVWHIRACLTYHDLFIMLKHMFRLRVLLLLLTGFWFLITGRLKKKSQDAVREY